MGAPVFKWRELLKRNKVYLFSSNFELYGDLSARVMHTLWSFSDHVQIYSVDEAFIKLPSLCSFELKAHGEKIARTLQKYTGIPVSVGIGPTKTLCKIATEFAKKLPNTPCFLMDPKDRFFEEKLKQIPIDDIWGVGRAMAPRMVSKNILTALDLKNANESMIRKDFGVFGARLIQELNGKPCFTEDRSDRLKKSIRFTRSFSKAIYQKEELKKITAHFAAMAAEKLRRQKAMATFMNVMVSTSRHEENGYKKSVHLTLRHPTSFTPDLIKAATGGFEKIFLPNKAYKRVGVTLMGIIPTQHTQYDLFGEKSQAQEEKVHKIMNCVDQLNHKFGKGAIHFLAEGNHHHKKTASAFRSPEFTTNWKDLLVIKI